MTTAQQYTEGSVLYYRTSIGTRRVQVTDRYDDIKNGRPGFEGINLDVPDEDDIEHFVWGYDSQIVRVAR